jgi:hypothetical protein
MRTKKNTTGTDTTTGDNQSNPLTDVMMGMTQQVLMASAAPAVTSALKAKGVNTDDDEVADKVNTAFHDYMVDGDRGIKMLHEIIDAQDHQVVLDKEVKTIVDYMVAKVAA